jgi:O-antigen ligase
MVTRQSIVAMCGSLIYGFLIALPFAASFSSAAVDGCIVVLVLSFILKRVLSGDGKLAWHPVFACFSLLLLVALLSFVNTINVVSSLQGMQKLLKYGFLMLIVFLEVRDVRHVQKIVGAAIAGLFLISIDGIYQFIFGIDFLRHNEPTVVIGLSRLTATLPNPNVFAGYLVLFIPMLATLTLYYAKGKARVVGIVIGLLALFCLVFTFCRSAALGLFLVLTVMSLIRKDRVMLVLLLLCALVAPFAIPSNVKDWSKTTNHWAELFLGQDRPIIFETALNMIKTHPFLGVGVNTFALNYSKYKLHNAVFDPGNQDKADMSWYAHDSYLQMTAETGIMYFLVFLALLFMLFRDGITFYRRTSDAFLKFSSLGIMLGLAAFLVHGLTETNLYYPKIAVLFWFQAALLMAMIRIEKIKSV